MTEKPKDLVAALDALEDVVERRLGSPDSTLSELATLMLGFPRDSYQRPRAHRMLGDVYGQLGRTSDALKELEQARRLAATLSPPNYAELGNAARALSALYAARGEDERAKDELISALTFLSIGGTSDDMVRLIGDVARSELDARHLENSALLFGFLMRGSEMLPVPDYAVETARINLVQALNGLGRHDEVHGHVKDSHATLTEENRRLRFLMQIEAARASAGLGRHDEAEGALLMAENFLPDHDAAIDHSEFIEAVTELQEVRAGESATESLKHLVQQYTEHDQPVRAVVAYRALASALLKRGNTPGALEALGRALKVALLNKFPVAEDVRTEILRRAGMSRLVDLDGSKSLIGQMDGRDLRFVKLKTLGRSSAGESSLAVDIADGEQVSIRMLDLSDVEASHREAALSSERRAYASAATLHDTRLAKVRDMRLTPAGILYTVQRYPEGLTLRELYAAAETPRLLDLLAGTAGALSIIHGRDLPHRDLTPDHVIIQSGEHGEERPVLVEIGLAPVDGSISAAVTAGTPPYVAPEQIAGEDLDTSADIYALGQMIAEVWGGRVPSRANLGRLFKRESEDDMPRAIGDLVRSMTAAEPSRRLTDLAEIIEILRAEKDQAEPS